ncbi:MAG: hypothetical protein H0W84_08365 [Bacteroidetes bacterium]|nr:hypothetical protein [Bacteroidota bacterium]
MTKNLKESLPALERAGFRYLSTYEYSFLQRIFYNLKMELEQNEKSLSSPSDNPKDNNDKKWVSILNSKENWARFKKDKTSKEIEDINILENFWNSQNKFAVISNESLVNALDVTLYCLSHAQNAIKEFEKNKRNLNVKFAASYGNFLKTLNEKLEKTKSQLSSAMSLRLKIAGGYNNNARVKIDNCDDVVYYIARNLNSRKALNAEERKILPLNPRCGLCTDTQNYYVKFYDRLRSNTVNDKNEESVKKIDQLHWSRIINKSIFPLTSKVPDFESITANKIYYYGFSFSEIGPKNRTSIAIPTFLNKFAPERYQTPAWFYWQDNMILSFWAKRQEFLANLQCLWPFSERGETKNKNNHEKCILLINNELRILGKDDSSFFAFTYKEMLKEWGACLKNLRAQILSAVKNPVAQNHIPITQMISSEINENRSSVKINDKKTVSKNNKKSEQNTSKSILEEIKQNEDEYQKWQSDSSDIPEIVVYPDSKNLRRLNYLFSINENRLSIHESENTLATVENMEIENKSPSMIEAALRAHR